MQISEIGEFGLIDKIHKILGKPKAGKSLLTGIGDDAAVFQTPPDLTTIATVDTLVEGIHFDLRYTDFHSLGWKALAVNLSDIAAMAGWPKWALVSLIFPERLTVENIVDLYRGIRSCARRFETTIIGGNISKSRSEFSITITALGEVKKNQWARRSAAQPGDVIAVTGFLGLSRTGFCVLREKLEPKRFPHAVQKHLKPLPRLDVIETCRQKGLAINACLDLSDGLSSDLLHICRMSGVGAQIEAEQLPLHPETKILAEIKSETAADYALNGGEDYELLLTMTRKNFERAKKIFRKQLTAIGVITSGRKMVLRANGKETADDFGRLPAFLIKDGIMQIKITDIQEAIRKLGFDGWLMYSFRKNNPIVDKILDLPSHLVLKRRYYYYIPANGTPQKLVHSIERGSLDTVPGDKTIFSSWQELEAGLKKITGGAKRIAMEYSHECAIPYVSIIDAGTIELIRKTTGAEIVSSADLVQFFDAMWDESQWQMHQEAGKGLIETVHEAFAFIKENIQNNKKITEFDVQKFMLQRFEARNLHSPDAPNCSVNENAGDPHYEPTETIHKEIRKNDFVLIDLWAKKKAPRSVYADYAWVGYVGETVPEKYEKIFQIVKGARDAAVDFLKKALASGQPVYGWQVDDASRQYIVSHGYGEYFTHRTGHSIGEEVHGNGANMDNMETKDNRRILPRTCFSIEPGIYFNDFGIRSEIDVYISERNEVIATGTPMQQNVIPILR